MHIDAGQIVLFYLFDVAESIDLAAIPASIGGPATAARLSPKPATPAYVQYDKPPLSFAGEVVGCGTVDAAGIGTLRVRCRVYEYGVLSLALSRAFSGDWEQLVAVGHAAIDNLPLEQEVGRLAAAVGEQLRPALRGAGGRRQTEDYAVFLVTALGGAPSATALLEAHGTDIARLLRGESHSLSPQERDTVLQHRLSYLADDLVIPTWNGAFIYDTVAGAEAALEIVEFANSQLLQFRSYDERLNEELTSIYATLQRPRWYDQWVGQRYTRAARHIHALFIDVTDVTDRTVNALKFTGDIYAARLFHLVAERLGLPTWKSDVEGKLKTLDAIARFAVERSSMARGQLLEALVVAILVFELAMALLGGR